MRGAMIAAGWLLIERFHWIIYVFGAFLVFTGIRMATHDDVDIEPEANPLFKLIRRVMPVTRTYEGQSFFVRAALDDGSVRLTATPLLVVLIMVETTDLVFAVDSIPAVFAITTDPFLVFTSNVFAILGLRSMYFLLAGIMEKFHFLKLGLGGRAHVRGHEDAHHLLPYRYSSRDLAGRSGQLARALGRGVTRVSPQRGGAHAGRGIPARARYKGIDGHRAGANEP